MEKYNLEQAQEEAQVLQQKVESGEVSSYSEAENKLELEKSEQKQEKIFSENEITHFTNLAENVRRIGSILSSRERDGLNPLIEERELHSFFSVAEKIEEIVNSTDQKSLDDLQDSINRLAYSLDQVGKIPPQRVLREDTENLRRLMFSIRELGDLSLNLKGVIGSRENSIYDGVIQGFNRVISNTEKVSLWLMRKTDILDQRSRY